MSSPESSSDRERIRRTVGAWTKANADYTDASAARSWAKQEITWGMFGVPEAEVGVLGTAARIAVVGDLWILMHLAADAMAAYRPVSSR